jgi:small nuclear ribonucleoprotein (snRNP)-like protein
MENIRIVRLKNGEDIVGQLINVDDSYDVIEPMTVDVEYRGKEAGLVMRHWLPIQLVKHNEINIKQSDVLCVLEPSADFAEYYVNTVEKIHNLLKARNLVDELDDDEVNDIMDALEELEQDGNTLH